MSVQNKDTSPSAAQQFNQVQHAIGIMSGKGGVGKSLVTGLLACAFRQAGCRVGVLDADITGPSIPTMFGLKAHPDITEMGIFPVSTASGIQAISINLLLGDPEEAIIWRGPLLAGAVMQFWQDVFWGKLDYLFIDLPPGTGDIPLTVMQSLPLDGIVMVSSPQALAHMVVRKAIHMCAKVEVPVLGLVQNMAFLECPSCQDVIYPFGHEQGETLTFGMSIPLLANIPIDPEISIRVDKGSIEGYPRNPFTIRRSEIEAIFRSAASQQPERKST